MSFDIIKQNFDKTTEVELRDFSSMFKDAYNRLKDLQVTGVEAFKEVTHYYKVAKDWKKQIESYRKKRIEPLRTEMATINDRVKEFVQPLDDIESLAKVKVDSYNAFLEEQKRIEEAKLAEACKILDVEMPAQAPEDKVLRGSGAIVYERSVQKFEVVNLAEVPLRYLQINESMIKQDLKLGVLEIPGVRVWEEKTTQIRSR